MKVNKTYKSAALAAIHETVSDLREAGAVDLKTMRRFDKNCLKPVVRKSLLKKVRNKLEQESLRKKL